MKIGVINAGNVGRALARAWAEADHDVMVAKLGSQEKLDSFVRDNPAVRLGTPAEVANFGDVVLFSVYWPQLDEALALAGPLEGKVVIDTMNPLQVSADFEHTYDLKFMENSSTSEELQRRLPSARVVKAFNTVASNLLDSDRWIGSALVPPIYVAGDTSESKMVVASLARDVGFPTLDTGPLSSARDIEQLNVLEDLIAVHSYAGAADRIAPAVLEVPDL